MSYNKLDSITSPSSLTSRCIPPMDTTRFLKLTCFGLSLSRGVAFNSHATNTATRFPTMSGVIFTESNPIMSEVPASAPCTTRTFDKISKPLALFTTSPAHDMPQLTLIKRCQRVKLLQCLFFKFVSGCPKINPYKIKRGFKNKVTRILDIPVMTCV